MHSTRATSNIHKLHPLPEKNRLGRSADFLHSGTGCIENSRARSMIDFFGRFQPEFFRTSTVRSEKFNHDFNHDFLHGGITSIKATTDSSSMATVLFKERRVLFFQSLRSRHRGQTLAGRHDRASRWLDRQRKIANKVTFLKRC